MLEKEEFARLNEIARLNKERELTKEELEERKILRDKYLKNMRAQVRSHLSNLKYTGEKR